MSSRLHVVGIRHHSPACAHLVRRVIEEVRPRHVLIEGPSDFNARIDEMLLGHELPFAIFTYYQDAARRHASWTPFCAYSPEWIALETGRAVGAEVRFCDLPAWHPAFEGRRNRYADLESERERARWQSTLAALCARTHTDDFDALWDHLFEQPIAITERSEAEQGVAIPTRGAWGGVAPPEMKLGLAQRLAVYFEELRGDREGDASDAPRESSMARWVAWALRESEAEPVVFVCGGWHAPRVKRDALALAGAVIDPPLLDEVPAHDEEGRPIRHGSYLVPYTYKRLDSFAGYDSGMPSPAYHEWVFADGHERAAERAMERVSKRVRARKQPLSTADLIAARSLSTALARLRGHSVTMRTDVLDGLAGALVKDGMEVPFPWARRGVISARTEPVLVEVVAALSGEREGKLAAGTPRPPLAADIERELDQHALVPTNEPRRLTISLRKDEGRAQSRILHRLAVLAIPGVVRDAGPEWATDALLEETWTISAPLERESAIIEASQWGATLETAALARLEAHLLDANGRLRELARVLGIAAFVGIAGLEARITAEVARAVSAEPSLGELGAAASQLLDLTLHGELFGAEGARAIDDVLIAAFDRGLWLLEGITGANAALDEAQVHAVVALRDMLKRGPAPIVSARDRADGVFTRRAIDPQSPPSIRGACLGALWSLDRLGDPHAASAHASRAVRGASLPNVLGDFLVGLFATARVHVLESHELVGAIDEVLIGLADVETLIALPSMRIAFSYFPPRERERIARLVLERHGGDAHRARAMIAPLTVSPAEITTGMALDQQVSDTARRYGLRDALDREQA